MFLSDGWAALSTLEREGRGEPAREPGGVVWCYLPGGCVSPTMSGFSLLICLVMTIHVRKPQEGKNSMHMSDLLQLVPASMSYLSSLHLFVLLFR